jgi:N-acetylmuramoyl-L-alanine amidase
MTNPTVMGSHVGGQNSGKLGCVYVGGLRRATGPNVGFDTRTDAQKRAMVELTLAMLNQFPTIQRVVGHMDLAATQCPGFDVKAWWGGIKTGVPVRPVPRYGSYKGRAVCRARRRAVAGDIGQRYRNGP